MVREHLRKSHGFIGVFALIVSLFLVGCGGGGGSAAGDGATGIASGSPAIASDLSSVDFGNQLVGQTAEREVTLASTGTADLDVGTIACTERCFIVSETCSNTTLAPNETCKMVVRFTPEEQLDYNEDLQVESSAGTLPITLTGVGKKLNVGISNVTANCDDSTVQVKVIISDFNKTPESELVEENFTLHLNDDPVAPISFSAGTVLEPVSVAVALDWSNSFRDFRPDIRESAKSFIDLLEDDDRAAVFKFAAVVDEAAQPYLDVLAGRDILKDAVDADFVGATRPSIIWDAVDHVIGATANEPNDKRAVIVLTDGFDDGSAVSLENLIAHAINNNVVVFTIGLGTVNPGVLERLAQGTGGIHFDALTTDNLQAIYQNIADILTNQYELSFANPSPASGGVLEIGVTDSSGWAGEGVREVPACP